MQIILFQWASYEIKLHYVLVYMHPYYQDVHCKIVEGIYSHIISLQLYPMFAGNEQRYVIDMVCKCAK